MGSFDAKMIMPKQLTWFRSALTGVLVFLLLLVFVGAIVRATGAGLGCPDWPRCWGAVIPPWKVEQVNLDKLDFEKFQLKAERLGRDPAEVTPDSILDSFNPVHTWTEFVNRLVTIPIGLFAVAAVIFGVLLPKFRDRWQLRLVSVLSLLIILLNAWMGRQIVYSGLKPGVITTHLALAIGLIVILVYGRWVAVGKPKFQRSSPLLLISVIGLLLLVVAEGIMGAQVRELTDELGKNFQGFDRSMWIDQIEKSSVYLIHRSFSWLIVIATLGCWWGARRLGIVDWRANAVLVLVLAMMVMGVVLAHVAILPLVQVLHVGAAALMITFITDWLLRLSWGFRKT
ncbi:MAG: COX15/CtaA family protein [Verrucomicrobiota bacterium]